MGYSVLLSNYRRYFKLASYLATHTRESIVIAMGLPSLEARPPPCRRPWGRSPSDTSMQAGCGLPSIEARPPAAARGGVPFGHLHAAGCGRGPAEAHACRGPLLLARTVTPGCSQCLVWTRSTAFGHRAARLQGWRSSAAMQCSLSARHPGQHPSPLQELAAAQCHRHVSAGKGADFDTLQQALWHRQDRLDRPATPAGGRKCAGLCLDESHGACARRSCSS